jgi:hypothetical protein
MPRVARNSPTPRRRVATRIPSSASSSGAAGGSASAVRIGLSSPGSMAGPFGNVVVHGRASYGSGATD